jgi:hypothetical protein
MIVFWETFISYFFSCWWYVSIMIPNKLLQCESSCKNLLARFSFEQSY